MVKNIKLAEDRRQKILELLHEDGSARVKELSLLFAVSEPTVRADLATLEEQGLISRKHGGAFLKSSPHQVWKLPVQNTDNLENKRKLAQKALEFISNEDSIILDAGSTTSELAWLMPKNFDYVHIVTNALNITLHLGQFPEFDIHLIGGQFKPPTLSTTGEENLEFFDLITTRTLFLATGGVSRNGELTYPSMTDIPVKRAMIKSAERTILLADSTKFYKSSFAVLHKINEVVDYLITDDGIEKETIKDLKDMGVNIIIAS